MAEQKTNLTTVSRMPMPRQGQGGADNALTPKDIYVILRRHIWLIIILTFIGAFLGGGGWFAMSRYYPKYTAMTYIKVLPPIDKDPTSIGGAIVNKDIQYGHRVSIANLIKQQRLLSELVTRDKIKETKWFKQLASEQNQRNIKAVEYLEKYMGVSAHRDGEFVTVTMTCGDPKESALIVNEMVDYFITTHGSKKKTEVEMRLRSLNDQMMAVRKDLDVAESALDNIRATFNFNDLEEHSWQDYITSRLESLQTDSDKLEQDIVQVRSQTQKLAEQATGPINEQVESQIERDPTLVMLTQQLALQEAQIASKMTRFGENHRVVREAYELINETKEKRRIRKVEVSEQTRQSNLKNAQDQLVIYQDRLDELLRRHADASKQKEQLDKARILYRRSVKERDERRATLEDMKRQIETWRQLRDDPDTPKVMAMGLAPDPLRMSSPKWEIYIPGGTFLGLMLGVGLAFLIELLDDRVKSPREVDKYLKLAVLGVIPDAAEDSDVEELDLCHVVREAPYSVISESYRRFRTTLRLSTSSESSKVILVSSGSAGEGKTSVAVNLATALAAGGKQVLLIDANFWQPKLQEIFAADQPQDSAEISEMGLSTYLSDVSPIIDVISRSGVENLDVMFTGMLPSNPAELLAGAKMAELIAQQRVNYDHVIIDGPPVLVVTDTKILASMVDGTVLVFNANITKRGAALRTIRELKEIEANLLGCVVFGVKALKGGYYHEQFRSYEKYQKLQLARSV